MDDRLTSILRRYSDGEISAERAADEMGATYNVADVYVLSREAGLPLPDLTDRSNGRNSRGRSVFLPACRDRPRDPRSARNR
jgi:hypothetical protein